ncbi:ABC transporter substrate-binding protein [Aureibacillus halotolerans]|uniref:Putative chitobiose transport system substrate-binding protein n=1 Tax=Aureibacillus halotolerans TaxID=1508390 RepID=A0A4R6UDV3_9BACI|nr:sugar ABC transporter substrate-binding protein [Aureibacillus halotolerans]TDQ42985.1 putative chitobiose transport system substrate-binding protein [Aureibacillus halotolerans]
MTRKSNVQNIMGFALLMFIMFLTGCSSGGSGTSDGAAGEPTEDAAQGETQEERTIEFMTISLSPTFDEYINGVIDAFEAENEGVTVEWKDAPYDQIEQLVMTSASSGDLPDVINLNTLFLKKLAGLGALVNMDEAAADVKDDYFEGIWQSGDIGDGNFAIPWYVSTSGLLYNEKLLQEAGFDTPPSTFEEAWEYSEVIYEKTGAYGMVIAPNLHTQMPLHGIPIVSEDGTEATINTPEAVELWTTLKEKYDQGLVHKGILLDQAKVPELYAQEKVAFWTTGPQLFRQVNDLAPEVYENSNSAPALVGEAEVQNASIMNLAVPKQSEHVDLAVDFAAFITNSEHQLAFSEEANILPSVKEAAEAEHFTQGEDSDDPAVKGNFFAAQQLELAQDFTIPHENAGEIAEVVNKTFQGVLINDGDPKQALADLETQINSLLQE